MSQKVWGPSFHLRKQEYSFRKAKVSKNDPALGIWHKGFWLPKGQV